jgi:toxin ParE1/3/4
MTHGNWRIRLGDEAKKDFTRILAYTRDTFGKAQFQVYKTTLIEALAALEEGPNLPAAPAATKSFPACGRSTSPATADGDGTSSCTGRRRVG